MIPGFDPLNIILLAVAIVIFWRLKSVLGQRTGTEKPPIDLSPKPQAQQPQDNVIRLPQAGPDDSGTESTPPKPVWLGHAAEGSSVAEGLDAIAKASNGGLDVGQFLAGAKAAYEMVLESFANGDRQTLKNLLAKDVYESFSAAIDQRAKLSQQTVFQFVGVKGAEVSAAKLEGRKASLTVTFRADLINAVLDKDGNPVSGDPKSIEDVSDVWTFERDVSSRDPNWKLTATGDDQP